MGRNRGLIRFIGHTPLMGGRSSYAASEVVPTQASKRSLLGRVVHINRSIQALAGNLRR
jgi:hypothetical protein